MRISDWSSDVCSSDLLSATTTSNVVTYPVVVTVDNADGTLLPGLTVNAEIEVSKRDDVLKVANAALRYKPSDDAAGGPAPRTRGGGGMVDDLTRTAARSEEHTSELQSLMRISYAVFCLKKKKTTDKNK